MKPTRFLWLLPALALLCFISCKSDDQQTEQKSQPVVYRSAPDDFAQVPTWTPDDMAFFLHGSMSTEVVPEVVLRTFMRIYPDLFPAGDLSYLGLIPDPQFGWPIGFSKKTVAHLGGLSSIGINCAACHVAEITPPSGGANVRVLGVTSHFDAEAFLGSVIVATFRTEDPNNMKKFLSAYLGETDPKSNAKTQDQLATQWDAQQSNILATLTADLSGTNGLAPGTLNDIRAKDLRLDHQVLANGADLTTISYSMLKLFHNMRACLHFPDSPPDKLPPPSGPGRNDAFGLLSASLFGIPQPPAPVKYGLVWNVDHRPWVHWDGNTRSPLGRNILASLGLGAPLIGHQGELDFALVKRQTDISEKIRPPRYPFAIDQTAAARGAGLYQASCAQCHDGEQTDARLYSPAQVGTDPQRAIGFTQQQADLFNKFFADLKIDGYTAPTNPPIRSTGKYISPNLDGVWARSPYLHNGSVRTMQELLMKPADRAKTFHRGSRAYDATTMGYLDGGSFQFDTTVPGNSNSGHDYGSELSPDQKRDLIEYLKTL